MILGAICVWKPDQPLERLCPIFKLSDIVGLAGGNITDLGVKVLKKAFSKLFHAYIWPNVFQGGVVGIDITWNCDLDWNFEKYCLPRLENKM